MRSTRAAIAWSIALCGAWACANGPTGAPRSCVLEKDWFHIKAVDRARVRACRAPKNQDEAYRCGREDYLEAVCEGKAAFHEELD